MNQIKRINIPDGHPGTRVTLRIMAALSREAKQSQSFCEFVKEMTCTVKTPDEMDSYMRARFRYVPEDIETLYAPRMNVQHYREFGYFIGDCDDITMMYCAIFYALGYPSRMLAMRTNPNDPNFTHVVPELFINQAWRRFDPTVEVDVRHVFYGAMHEYV